MSHPYRSQPPSAFWRRAIERTPCGEVDPVVSTPFTVSAEDRVVTAGSCFAQHISRHLAAHGFRYHVTEAAHPLVPAGIAAEMNYGTFSARYGNIYTSRQLVQLFDRAYGRSRPQVSGWRHPQGYVVDPFRPQVQPGGFADEAEMLADREQHLACVRRAFEELDVLVFTLGLTECWVDRRDGTILPLCPGVAGGDFDAQHHALLNLSAAEVVEDMRAFSARLREVNAEARIIVTVSPVPLIATAEPRHVLESTTYSKAVLRVAAEEFSRGDERIAYFPSYEIITGPHSGGRYFAPDRRSVTAEGVAHVMRVFLRHFARVETKAPVISDVAEDDRADAGTLEATLDVVCDEEILALDAERAGGSPPV